MLRWLSSRRGEKGAPQAGAEQRTAVVGGGTGAGLDAALDAIGGLLRAYGARAIDTDEVSAEQHAAECDAWARHVLTGAPAPGQDPEEARAGVKRWNDLVAFVRARREAEIHALEEAFGELRDALIDVARKVHAESSLDRATDGKLRDEVGSLRGQAMEEGVSLHQLRSWVVRTTRAVEKTVQEREERHVRALEDLAATMRSMQNELHRVARKAETDELTQLGNRASLDSELERALDLGHLTRGAVSLLMVDVDHFKRVNDTLGHRAGDAALQAVARTMVGVVLRKGDFIGRYGGDEFAVILYDCDLSSAGRVAERINEAVRGLQLQHDGKDVPLTVSIGAAQLDPEDDVASWVERADQALADAKDRGRDGFFLG